MGTLMHRHTRSVTPPRPVMRLFWNLHKAVRRISGGRLGTSEARGDRLGTLFLHTLGHRSGKARANGLFYVVDGSKMVVVASNAGSEKEPAWWRNLQAQPKADVEVAGRRRHVQAREANPVETERLWARLIAANPAFADYRAKVRRPIPIVILEPHAGSPVS